jgi:hypothetical protein
MLSISGFLYLLFLGAAYLDTGNFTLWLYIGGLMLGIGQIVAGGTLFDVRKFLDSKSLSQAAGTIFIIGGSLMFALIGIYLIGWVAIGVGNFLLGILLFSSPVPESKVAAPDGSAGPAP